MVEVKAVRIAAIIDAFLVPVVVIVIVDSFISKLCLYPSNSCV